MSRRRPVCPGGACICKRCAVVVLTPAKEAKPEQRITPFKERSKCCPRIHISQRRLIRSYWKAVHTIAVCPAGRNIPRGVRGGDHDVEVRLVFVKNELVDQRRPWGKLGGLEVHRHPVHVLQIHRAHQSVHGLLEVHAAVRTLTRYGGLSCAPRVVMKYTKYKLMGKACGHLWRY